MAMTKLTGLFKSEKGNYSGRVVGGLRIVVMIGDGLGGQGTAGVCFASVDDVADGERPAGRGFHKKAEDAAPPEQMQSQTVDKRGSDPVPVQPRRQAREEW